TEILTSLGWRGLDDVDEGTEVLCYEVKGNDFGYIPATAKHVYDYDGGVYRLQGDDTDQIVTPEHRCVVLMDDKWGFVLAKDLAKTTIVPVLSERDLEDWKTAYWQRIDDARPGADYIKRAVARVTKEHYKGRVWCVTVPTGAFVARRNGKIFVTGNSQGFPKS